MPTFDQLSDYVQQTGSLTDTEATSLLKGAAGWINEGYKQAVRDIGSNVASLTEASLTSGTAEYSLSTLFSSNTDILRLRTLYVDTPSQTRMPLSPIAEHTMDEYRGQTAVDDTGDPTYYTVLGYSTLVLYPTPGASMSIGGTYHKRPTALSADGDIPTALPEEFHFPLIGNYALFKLCEYEGRLDEAERAWARYQAGVAACEKDLMRFGAHRPAPLRPASGHAFRGVVTAWDRMRGQ